MNHTLLQLKAALTALGVTLTTILGWKGILSLIWVIAMGIDYLSGTLAAMKNHEWSSETARSGLWHKAGTVLAVLAAALTDGVIYLVGEQLSLGITWTGLLLPLTLSWYILTEAGSILENTVKLGASIPGWLIKILKISLKSINAAGDTEADEQEESH
jgi:toxin secretion/phage lysis holin